MTVFGPEVVVYKLGIERKSINIEGLMCAREQEVVQWIDHTLLNQK